MPMGQRFTRCAGFLATLLTILASGGTAVGQKASPPTEQELIAVLRSNALAAEKAITCKRLAIYGSSMAVPELAKLLPDESLSSWARIALEAIPGEAASEALLKATETLKGRLLIGTINSIGVRRDAAAVDALTGRLRDQEADVASAAAVALGRIGNSAATQSLRQALGSVPAKVRSAVAEGCVLCAEHLLSQGKDAEAAQIYDEVRKADVPRQRIVEATRGAILARKQDGIPLLLEQFRSPDKAMFQIALSTAREFPGSEVDKALAGELKSGSPDRAALLIQAMADRSETVVLPAILEATRSGAKQVRMAAIEAFGRVGNASSISPLLEIATQADDDLVQAVTSALARLSGPDVDKVIISRLPQASGKIVPVLIEVIGKRRIEATGALVKALDDSNSAVRGAALEALGSTLGAKDLSVLIDQVVTPRHPEDVASAGQALKAASVRMPDREACAKELTKAMESASLQTKLTMLDILAAVGGTNALASVGAAAKSSEPQLQDQSTRLLGEWMTIDAAPVLLDLAKSGGRFQSRTFSGYIRIARQFVMPEQQRVEMCRSALDLARQPDDQKKVLEVLKRYPSLEMLKLAIQISNSPDLKEDAVIAVRTIASKLTGNQKEVREILSKAALDN